MADQQTHLPQPVVVNVHNGKSSTFWSSWVVRTLLSQLGVSIGTYLVGSYRLIPYACALGIWWFGGRAELPEPPGSGPTTREVDKRVDEIRAQVIELEAARPGLEEKVKTLEEALEAEKNRVSGRIQRLEGEKSRLAGALETSREETRQITALRDDEESQREQGRQLAERVAAAMEVLRLQKEIDDALDAHDFHINAQCTKCHAAMAIKKKDRIGKLNCNNCQTQVLAIEAVALGMPERWRKMLNQ